MQHAFQNCKKTLKFLISQLTIETELILYEFNVLCSFILYKRSHFHHLISIYEICIDNAHIEPKDFNSI